MLAFSALVVLGALAGEISAQEKQAARGPERWEDTIKKFEDADKLSAPPQGAILLVGVSNARRWTDVARYFPGETVINRGFGGARLADVVFFIDRIVLPYAPKTIVLNAGGNDLSAGRLPEDVRDACRTFVQRVHAASPKTKIYAVAIPPTLNAAKSAASLGVGRRTNALLQELAATSVQFTFIDIVGPFLDAQGRPRPELFVADGTHFTPKGYEIVAGLLRAQMEKTTR